MISIISMSLPAYIVTMKRKSSRNQLHKENANPGFGRLVDSLQLPRDICMGALRVTLTGNAEAWIENYRGILEYSEEEIWLQGKNCRVCFEGKGLSIDYYTNEDMKISGCIGNVRYE